MIDLTNQQIADLARLCRLEFSQEELDHFSKDLKRIVAHMAQLNAIDLNSLAPYSHIEEQGPDTLRLDVIGETLPRTTFLANAPEQVGGMVRVPPILHHVSENS